MTGWAQKVFQATKQYTFWDFAILKLCLVTMGILIGMYFSQQMAPLSAVIWIAFLLSYAVIVYKTLVKYAKN